MLITSRGMRKYSTDRARANEFGGTITDSACTVTNDRSSNAFGSMIALFTFVKILNSSETRRSYPYDDNPYEITPSRTCFSLKGSIIPCWSACSRIQRSLLIDILSDFLSAGSLRLLRFLCSIQYSNHKVSKLLMVLEYA